MTVYPKIWVDLSLPSALILTMASTSSSEPTSWTPPEGNCDKCGAPASWADEYVMFSYLFLLHEPLSITWHAWRCRSELLSKYIYENVTSVEFQFHRRNAKWEMQVDTELIVEWWHHTSFGYLPCKPTHVALRVHTWKSIFTSQPGATHSKSQLEGPIRGSSRSRVWEENDQFSQQAKWSRNRLSYP